MFIQLDTVADGSIDFFVDGTTVERLVCGQAWPIHRSGIRGTMLWLRPHRSGYLGERGWSRTIPSCFPLRSKHGKCAHCPVQSGVRVSGVLETLIRDCADHMHFVVRSRFLRRYESGRPGRKP